jgi:RNA polymerase sigma-70 factor (ECF subfamily)
MSDTSASLLDRLRKAPGSSEWQRFVDLYSPLIRGWLRRHSLAPHDSDDVVQEVMTVIVRKLPAFQKEPRTGAFRGWLRSITVNCVREFWHRRCGKAGTVASADVDKVLNELEDPASDLSGLWDREHDRHVMQQLLEMIRPNFEANTWKAFCRVALDGLSATETAAELGMTVNAVFIAKSRVMTQLRQEAQGLVD